MSKIKAFFYIFKNSLLSPSYYYQILKTDLTFSIKYFVTLMVFGSFLTTIFFFNPVRPGLTQDIRDQIDTIMENYPQDLVINIENGVISTNKPEPYIISFKDLEFFSFETEEQNYSQEFPSNFIVFDTNGTINDLENLDTLVLINNKNIIYRSENSIEAQPTADLPDTTFGIQEANDLAARLKDLAKFITPILIVIATFAMLFYFGFAVFSNMVFLLAVASVLLLLGTLMGISHPFRKYYQLALHTVTVPTFLDLIMLVLIRFTSFGEGINPMHSIGVLLIIHFIYGFLIISSIREKEIELETHSNIEKSNT